MAVAHRRRRRSSRENPADNVGAADFAVTVGGITIRRLRQLAGLTVVLVAPALGGATAPWSAGITLALVALALLTGGRDRPPRVVVWGGVALLGCAACSLLPVGWAAMPEWRRQFGEVLRLDLGGAIAPQPRLVGERLVYLAGGMAFCWWSLGQRWTRRERRWLAAAFCIGIAALAALSLACFHFGVRIPFWLAERGFGPFPNRNQTGALFALAGILAAACWLDALRRRRLEFIAWIPVVAVLAAGVFASYSRAAVVVFFVGLAAWACVRAGALRSAKWAAVVAALILLGVAGFIHFGGATVGRFFGGEELGLAFRGLIYQDTLRMVMLGPWSGVGLGNFAGVFPQFRSLSVVEQTVIHPESDWLWLAAEAGLMAVVVAVAMLGSVVANAFPMAPNSGRSLRWGCLVAVLAFAVHGAVDVGGHRLGTMLPALFLAGLARPGEGERMLNRRWWRLAGPVLAILLLPGAIWIGRLPDYRALGVAALNRGDYAGARAAADAAIRRRPLAWDLYFIRGLAGVRGGQPLSAVADFRRARSLEPYSVGVPFEEGAILIQLAPKLALPAWRETLRRCLPDRRVEWFGYMVARIGRDEESLLLLQELAGGDPALLVACIDRAATPAEAERLLAGLEAAAGRWEEADRERLKLAVARHYARSGEYGRAVERILGLLPRPVKPVGPTKGSTVARQAVLRDPTDLVAAWELSQALLIEGDAGGALAALDQVAANPECPRHFHRQRALLRAERGDWKEAWEALERAR